MKISIVLVALLCSISANTQAQDAAKGREKFVSCTACHGAQGQGGVGPKLQGQKAEVIVQKLTTYKNKGQIGPQSQLMWSMAGALSADDIKNIAAYTATLK
jgi:cytochrome c553